MTPLLHKTILGLKTYRLARKAINNQYQPDKIRQIQNKKLRLLIEHCYSNIKYYRELFDRNGIKPADIKTIEDIKIIPILTKQQIRQRQWDFFPKELPRCRISRTSGSTGTPLCIFSDENSRINNSAAVIRSRKALCINFVNETILTPLKNPDSDEVVSHWTFLQGIHKTFYVNPYRHTQIGERIMKQLKNPIIIGITPAIKALALSIRDNILPTIKPKAVITTGQSTEAATIRLLQNTFNCPIADVYACNEAGDIAWQCLNGQYHINSENVIVEIIKDGKPTSDGQTGEIVITNLNRFSMPILRYKNGDLAKFSSKLCPCRCKLPLIEEILGRTGENIYLPNGKEIHWHQLKGLMNHQQIRWFQLVQEKDSQLKIKLICEPKADKIKIEELLEYRFNILFNNSIPIKFEQVKNITRDDSGKVKLVISHYRP